MLKPALFCLCALATLNGCAAQLKAVAAGSLIRDVAAATAKHDDLDLALAGAPTYLLLLEGLLEGNPDNPTLLSATAEAYISYGALIESESIPRAKRIYARAREHARRSLHKNGKAAALLEAPYAEFSQIDRHLKAKDLERVFWLASSWGAWISLNTESMHALAELPKVIYLMEWVLDTDESFYYGSPHIFLGVYHAALPPMLGGSPEKSKAHFDKARALSSNGLDHGQMLMVDVQMARYYARQIFDRELYTRLLENALAQAPEAGPLTLQNVAAQRLARQLLEETDDYF